jgi:transposase-like protein
MLDFRLNLSKFQRKSLMKSLSDAIESGKLTLINRIRAILAVGDGYSFSDIATILRVSKESVRQWVIKYFCGG